LGKKGKITINLDKADANSAKPENYDANSAGELALGERLHMSLGSGVPIYKQTMRYYWRAKKEKGVWVNDSLLL
jgi:hypothetical protein